MYTVFLAGGMASGKSTVARMLEKKGARRLDLDQVSRDVLAPGSHCARALAEAFGQDLLDPNTGEINRRELAARAFATPEGVQSLEDIELPFIKNYLMEALDMERRTAQACDVCIVEVPLLDRIEDLIPQADEVVAVICPYELRKKRACVRGVSAEDFKKRVALQPSDEYLRSQADTIIDNARDEAFLVAQIDAWWDRLTGRLQSREVTK
ncbi:MULTISPECIES: dephospho-CoA kinase [Atopobiaceae]|uniref:dephospho-CoA kinase n=1 Tax=Atopobiaceae TaxID=1643824 RepID=UPI00034E658B|nr:MULTISPECIES: dephospho-CoA kinase [Atopobiaceae]EPD78232.1 dephospho-CoA kinase [Atopobium sp. oral taxon 199 str. F0494]